MRDAILSGKSHNEIVELASSQGVRRLEDSAKKKVREGTTSIEEIHRVLTTFA
jgi:type II secretory ATPase GspE/PulE/Tfp pilus assembly ATPase PilB-like protein